MSGRTVLRCRRAGDGGLGAPIALNSESISRRAARYGSFPVVALAATTALEAGERGSLSQAADGIQTAFGVSDAWIGALPAAMTVIGVVGSFPFGHLADHVRRTWLLAGAMAVWIACMGLGALAPGFAFLFVTRLGVGTVEANGPASVSLICDYYPVRNRAKMMGLYASGGLVGSTLGLGLAGVIVDNFGWRAAFWMWIPLGLVAVGLLLRAPEPRRGDQDADFHLEPEPGLGGVDAAALGGVDAAALAGRLDLPPPSRAGTLDYERAGWREAFREVLKIRSMWFGVLAITISQSLLNGLGFWAVPYFKREFDLSGSRAGGYVVLFGLGAAVGVVGGGFVSDRLLRRGIVNARVYVVAFSSMAATAFLLPAFLSRSLTVALPFFLVSGLLLTLPLAPADALLTDVVVAPLRGRAAAMRSVVRSVSGLSPWFIGQISNLTSLRTAVLLFIPLYAIGGIVMLAAARTYPADLAYVVAESRRTQHLEGSAP